MTDIFAYDIQAITKYLVCLVKGKVSIVVVVFYHLFSTFEFATFSLFFC